MCWRMLARAHVVVVPACFSMSLLSLAIAGWTSSTVPHTVWRGRMFYADHDGV